ncbi:hypothetical protein [Halobaculum sp. MBLA0143]|uniref:hypothetical protein n=1 Tax=Halobaculum sp. MBLA0143 TaxID=3079933 RepID=UPI00352459E7
MDRQQTLLTAVVTLAVVSSVSSVASSGTVTLVDGAVFVVAGLVVLDTVLGLQLGERPVVVVAVAAGVGCVGLYQVLTTNSLVGRLTFGVVVIVGVAASVRALREDSGGS